jgi:hypothetical protein
MWICVSATAIAVPLMGIVAAILFIAPHPRIDQASLDQIQMGMTEQEVRAVIGAPPGDYSVHEVVDTFGPHVEGKFHQEWVGNGMSIVVGYDADGRVVDKGKVYHTGYIPRRTWFQKVLDWIGL